LLLLLPQGCQFVALLLQGFVDPLVHFAPLEDLLQFADDLPLLLQGLLHGLHASQSGLLLK
jgi:hypothetical protein